MLAKYLADLVQTENTLDALKFLIEKDYINVKLPPPRQEVETLAVLTHEFPLQLVGQLKNKNIFFIHYRDFKLSIGYTEPNKSFGALTSEISSLHKVLRGLVDSDGYLTFDEIKEHCEMFFFPENLKLEDSNINFWKYMLK